MTGSLRVAGVALLALAACADPIVGGRCAAGLVLVGGRCVPPDATPDGGLVDGSSGGPDAALDGGAPDGDVRDSGGMRDGGTADSGVVACDLGEIECDGLCVRADDPMHCGTCELACAAGDLCADGVCVRRCPPPLVPCGGSCVDLATDPDHCGACGTRCPSGICLDGECGGPTAGHVVVVGHDYQMRRVGMSRLVGNGVFLAPGAPVRVLAFDEGSASASVTGSDRAIDQVATERGRAWEKIVAVADKVTRDLADADVLLVYAQSAATDAELVDHGARWSRALSTFLARGGIVVVLEGGGTNGGTHQLLEAAGLFTADGRSLVMDETVDIVAPADAIAVGVPLTYRSESDTFVFDTAESIVVAECAAGPVAIHRVVVPAP